MHDSIATTAQCGDELEAKLQLEGTPLDQRPDFPLCSFDANDWAKAFMHQHTAMGPDPAPIDLEVIRAWFASALMTGYDHRAAQAREHDTELLLAAAREIRTQRERLLVQDAKVSTMEILAGLGRDQSVRNYANAGVMGTDGYKHWRLEEQLEKRAEELARARAMPTSGPPAGQAEQLRHAGGAPKPAISEGEQLSRDLTEQARSESLGG